MHTQRPSISGCAALDYQIRESGVVDTLVKIKADHMDYHIYYVDHWTRLLSRELSCSLDNTPMLTKVLFLGSPVRSDFLLGLSPHSNQTRYVFFVLFILLLLNDVCNAKTNNNRNEVPILIGNSLLLTTSRSIYPDPGTGLIHALHALAFHVNPPRYTFPIVRPHFPLTSPFSHAQPAAPTHTPPHSANLPHAALTCILHPA